MKTKTDNTEAVIYGMLTENTGRHMLDSGGATGRTWQRNQLKTLEDFRAEPEAWLDARDYPEITKSAFWHLVKNLKHDPALNAGYHKFAEAYPDTSWRDINDLWLNSLGVPEGDGDFYAPRWSFNTYNFDGWLVNQTLQGEFFELGNKGGLILQVHGGADVRGGYTAPQVFEYTEGRDEFIVDGEQAFFSCSSEECDNRLSARGNYELELFDGSTREESFSNLEEVKTCPCGGSWIN